MRGRRPREAATISLLPILSIQKCTMGVMVVIICAQNLVSLGETADQFLEIAGTAQDREPVYVECQQKGILIHPEKTEVALTTLQGPGPSAFHQLLEQLQGPGAGKKYLVLLVRPEGVTTFERCYRMAHERRLTVGKDALLSGGNIVLTRHGKPILSMPKAGR
jgi:hypothetical protein